MRFTKILSDNYNQDEVQGLDRAGCLKVIAYIVLFWVVVGILIFAL